MREWILVLLFLLPRFRSACRAFSIQPGTWNFQGHPIAYEKTATAANVKNKDATPVLLLNGFGMGSFHQHRLMEALHKEQQQDHDRLNKKSTIYAIDYLGQGKSWPELCNDGTSANEKGLQYSGQTWVNQIIAFLEEVVVVNHNNQKDSEGRVHLVGNSVGGHLAVCIAAARPDLIATVTLLNATPVWGLNLPFWSGHLPAPAIPKQVGRYLFDRMRDETTITEFLDTTYVNPDAYDDTLVQQVRACTEGDGGHAAFASILWSPPVAVKLPCGSNDEAGFYDCLEALKCDVLLCFGRDDPWCKPAFAKRMLQSLANRQEDPSTNIVTQRYVELSNVGHCANHEAPTATAQILSKWIGASDRRPEKLSLLPSSSDHHNVVQEAWGETVVQERKGEDIPLGFVDRLAVTFV